MSTTEACLDLHRDVSVAMLDHEVTDRRAWTRHTVQAADWTVPLADAAVAELLAMAEVMTRQPLPVLMLSPDQFALPACRDTMARAKAILRDGIGVTLVDRLPLDRLTTEQAMAAHWVLGQLIATPVAQKWDGTMIYDVTDTGRTYGYGVRGSWTNVELSFHTDNSFGVVPPDYVGLLCLMPAREGGISRFCSLYTVHNEMLRRHPRHLARLYRPFYYDRQAEHAPGAPKVSWTPCLRYEGGRLHARFSPGLVRKGYALMETPLDAEAEDALAALDDVMKDTELWMEFTIDRGQLQYLNNREVAHFRSEFKDDETRKRHLIRLWFRENGRRFYDG
ncbi:MAG TPA: TauD/TfdA family dioxygenase [Candidatus Methylomirabilis sp.]|nr:TauD/TfdA family dioxygenase [Candidatus Methylomirabilis sp.]